MINTVYNDTLHLGVWQDYLHAPDDTYLSKFISLIVAVVPVSYIFRCTQKESFVRLIIVSDPSSYQPQEETINMISLATTALPLIQIMYRQYGTINDLLKSGNFFLASNCIEANCIYKKCNPPLVQLSNCTLEKLKTDAKAIIDKGMNRANDFFDSANLYFEKGKLNLAAFMLHQTCEQLFRFIIMFNWGKDFKSHQLSLLRKEAGFFCPDIKQIFHSNERKELKWMECLQSAYIGARYEDDYTINREDLEFLKAKINALILRINEGLLQL